MKYFSKYFNARVVLLILAMLLSSPLVTWAQGTITIKGVVKDAQKEPLAGVSIRVKGTTAGTTTTPTGDYTLQNVSRNATLIFSYIGMKKQEVPVSGRTTIDVVLEDGRTGGSGGRCRRLRYSEEGQPHWGCLLYRL